MTPAVLHENTVGASLVDALCGKDIALGETLHPGTLLND